jgi:hypothetical protein
MRYQSQRYRPEKHYMRGPGPAWIEKHIAQSEMPGEGDRRKAPMLIRSIELKLRRWLPMRWRTSRSAAHDHQWNVVDQLGPWWV